MRILIGLFSLLIAFIFKDVPFWGDQVALISHPANYFYDTHFQSFIIAENYDTGHPPLIPFLMSIVWLIFGRSLLVSHLFVALIYFFTFHFYLRFAEIFLQKSQLIFAALFFLLHPVLLSQTVCMGADLFLLLFFFTGLYGIEYQKKYLLLSAYCFLMLSSLRGGLFIVVLFFYQMNKNSNYSYPVILKEIFLLFLSTLPFIFWNLYHLKETGWILMHQESPWIEQRGIVSINGFFSNCMIFLTGLMEYGFIIIWLILLFASKKVLSKKLIFLCLISVIVSALFFLITYNPILARYLLLIEIPILILASQGIASLPKQRRTFLTAIVCLIFCSSHFFVYPQKINSVIKQNWDATLAFLPYQNLRTDALDFLQQAENKSIAAGFPMYQSYKDSNLSEAYSISIVKLEPLDLDTYRYVILSEIMNDVPDSTVEVIKNSWNPVHQNNLCKLSMSIYENPK